MRGNFAVEQEGNRGIRDRARAKPRADTPLVPVRSSPLARPEDSGTALTRVAVAVGLSSRRNIRGFLRGAQGGDR